MSEVEVLAQPASLSTTTQSRKRRAPPSRISAATRRLVGVWNDIQIENQSTYSIERLESLDFYRKTTSSRRAIAICVLTPLPVSTLAVLLECLPLQSPSEGWRANWVFWLRLLLVQLVLGFVANSQMIRYIPDLPFTMIKRVAIAVGVSGAFVGTCLVAAIYIGFPVPLMMQLTPVPIVIYNIITLRVVLGPAPFAPSSPLKTDFDRCNRFLGAFMTLNTVFPLYKVLYEHIPVANRGIAVLILPIWKFASKHFMVKATRELEDTMLMQVALCVDFLSSLFISVCMSTSKTISLMVLFVAVNTGQSLLEFQAMSANSRALLLLVGQRRNSQPHVRKKKFYHFSDSTNLLTIVLDSTHDSAFFPPKSLQNVRLWACLPYPLTAGALERLQALEKLGVYGRKDENLQITSLRRLSRHRKAVIAPSELVLEKVQPGPNNSFLANADRSKQIVAQGVRLLSHSEYVVLVLYVECIVPIIFLVYKSVVEQLPNVVYFPGGGGNWDRTSVANVSVFALLEVGLFLSFTAFVQRKFAFSPVHQLAFVLETEFYPVQAILFCLILNVLQYELKHFGRYTLVRTLVFVSSGSVAQTNKLPCLQ